MRIANRASAGTTINSRRGLIFFWIVQVLLAPSLICFVVTGIMRFSFRSRLLWELGAAMALVQIPFTALATVFAFAAATGELLPRLRTRTMYLEILVSVMMIALVFLWRGVYRVF